MADWSCARCGAADGRNRRAYCCTPCREEMDAQGLAWCAHCESEQPRQDGKNQAMCVECRRERDRARGVRVRGRAPRPTLPSVKPADISAQIVMAWAALADPEFLSSFDLAA